MSSAGILEQPNVQDGLKGASHFNKGRTALWAILSALGIKKDDEVIIPGFTCLGVPLPILSLGAKPVYADIDPANYNIDVTKIESLVTKRTRAIVAQHTFGIPASMNEIIAIARRHHLVVIEDCCHALASTYEGRRVGTFGQAAFYSYEWGKPLVLGGGGSAVGNDSDLQRRCHEMYATCEVLSRLDVSRLKFLRMARSIILRPGSYWQIRSLFRILGSLGLTQRTFDSRELAGQWNHFKKRMPVQLQSELVRLLDSLAENIRIRKMLAEQYEQGLKNIHIETFHQTTELQDIVFLRYPLKAKDKFSLLTKAREQGVEIGDWFLSPVHPLHEDQWGLVHYEKGACPAGEAVSKQIVTLPIYDNVRPKDIDRTLQFLARMKREGLI